MRLSSFTALGGVYILEPDDCPAAIPFIRADTILSKNHLETHLLPTTFRLSSNRHPAPFTNMDSG